MYQKPTRESREFIKSSVFHFASLWNWKVITLAAAQVRGKTNHTHQAARLQVQDECRVGLELQETKEKAVP